MFYKIGPFKQILELCQELGLIFQVLPAAVTLIETGHYFCHPNIHLGLQKRHFCLFFLLRQFKIYPQIFMSRLIMKLSKLGLLNIFKRANFSTVLSNTNRKYLVRCQDVVQPNAEDEVKILMGIQRLGMCFLGASTKVTPSMSFNSTSINSDEKERHLVIQQTLYCQGRMQNCSCSNNQTISFFI